MKSELTILKSNLLKNIVYTNISTSQISPSGAWGNNVLLETNPLATWRIEQQRYGEDLIINGILYDNTSRIETGFLVFDWGKSHQIADGSFGTTQDAFHSTSFFVESVSRCCLLLQQSAYATKYSSKITDYKSMISKATQWMIQDTVWTRGTTNNQPYTHRRYLVASSLGLASKLLGGVPALTTKSSLQINDGLSLQLENGINPEKGGYDISYHYVGLYHAVLWAVNNPTDPLYDKVSQMLSKGLNWAATMIQDSGEINTTGSTRVGEEVGPGGTIKTVDWRKAICALIYWMAIIEDSGDKIAGFYK